MNLNKLLKNPIAVTILAITAVAYIFFTAVYPMISNKNEEAAPVEIQTETMVVSAQEDAVPVLTGDSTVKNRLMLTGWKRIGGRDPFIDENRSRSYVNNFADNESAFSQQTDISKLASEQVAHKSRPLIQAIAVGPKEKVVLLGKREYREGDTCIYGIISKIESDSVIVNGSTGLRTLHF